MGGGLTIVTLLAHRVTPPADSPGLPALFAAAARTHGAAKTRPGPGPLLPIRPAIRPGPLLLLAAATSQGHVTSQGRLRGYADSAITLRLVR